MHDILTLVAFCRFSKYEPAEVTLIGLGKQSGALVAAAAFQAGSAVDRVAIGTGGFRFGTITDIRDPMLAPGAVRYGDVPGLLALSAPKPMWLADEAAAPDVVSAAYKSANATDKLSLYKGDAKSAADAAAAWVIG